MLGRGARRVDRVVDANPVVGVAVGESALQRHPASNWMPKRGWGTNRRHPREAPAGRRADVASNGHRAGPGAQRVRMVEEQRARADLPYRHGVVEAGGTRRDPCGCLRASWQCAGDRRVQRLSSSRARGSRGVLCGGRARRGVRVASGAERARTPAPRAIHRRSIGSRGRALGRSRAARPCEMLVGDMAQLAFRVLGSLEATVDGQPVRLTGRRERALLGVLLLNAGTVVSIEQLIDGVWGDPAPAECPPHGARVRLAGSRSARRCDADLDPGARVHGRARSRRTRRRQLRRARAGGAPRARGDAQRGRASLVRRGARPLARRRTVRRRAGGQRARRRRFARRSAQDGRGRARRRRARTRTSPRAHPGSRARGRGRSRSTSAPEVS